MRKFRFLLLIPGAALALFAGQAVTANASTSHHHHASARVDTPSNGACGYIYLTNSSSSIEMMSTGEDGFVELGFGSQWCAEYTTGGHIKWHHRVNGSPNNDVLQEHDGVIIMNDEGNAGNAADFDFTNDCSPGFSQDCVVYFSDDTVSTPNQDSGTILDAGSPGNWTNWKFNCQESC